MAGAILKCCRKCGLSKPVSDFPLCRGKPRARCKPCHTADARNWAERNHDAYKERLRKWHRENVPPRFMGPPLPKHILRARNREAARRWREANVEAFDQMRKAWLAANKHIEMERVRRRQATERRATPRWANREAMQDIYRQSLELTKATGVAHEVDHIVPLISKFVCGLHCEANLRVLPRKENRMKTNRHWPDMWESL